MLDRKKLYLHMWSKGIQGKAWCMIRMIYERVDNKVTFGEYESDLFEVLNGVNIRMFPVPFSL